ncbi:MAG: glutamate--tRNA ligase [bacterium]|nr:glutamate--tRNA ligase [bacterium]
MKTRFAPAPTGYLHLGGARTALFNYLYAKKMGGKFLLRIEDTDFARSTKESCEAILSGLKWLGIEWDEGPYHQSDRLAIYKEKAENLLAQGKAYKCYCTQDELACMRKKQQAEGKPPIYDGRCKERKEEAKPYTLRFSVPEEKIKFTDLIKGEMEFESSTIGDFVIARSDGIPTYNLVCAIDDADMGITHILRGDDHISNTPKQILLYSALGISPPEFAHLPLIFGQDKTPLSKRHGAVDIGYYRNEGFLPEAMVNYIALLGFSTEDSQQIMSRKELISLFSLERVGKSAGIFDPKKLLWMNGEYIRSSNIDRLVELSDKVFSGFDKDWTKKVLELYRERIKKMIELKDQADFFLKDEIEIKEDGEKILRKEGVLENLKKALEVLSDTEPFTKETCEQSLRTLAESLNVKAGEIFHPLRVAVTGRTVSPPLFDTLELLGKDNVLRKLEKVIKVK